MRDPPEDRLPAPFPPTNRSFTRARRVGRRRATLSPIEPHGFRKPSSWLDEYRRILKLFEESL